MATGEPQPDVVELLDDPAADLEQGEPQGVLRLRRLPFVGRVQGELEHPARIRAGRTERQLDVRLRDRSLSDGRADHA